MECRNRKRSEEYSISMRNSEIERELWKCTENRDVVLWIGSGVQEREAKWLIEKWQEKQKWYEEDRS